MRAAGPKVGSQDWFDANQMALLFLANTRRGRKMLRIYDDCPKDRSIIRLRPNGFDCLDERHPTFLHALWSMRKPRDVQIVGDFRCRPKIANRLAHSWVRHVPAWNRYIGEMWSRAGSPFRVLPAFAASPLTVYPDPNVEVNTVDGWVRHSGTNVTWATIRDGAGTAANDSSTSPPFFEIDAGATAWNALYRCIFLFLTSSLGASATISAATLSTKGTSAKQDTLVATPTSNVYSSAPATNTALVAGDFDSLGTTAYSDTAITYAGWSNSAYNDFVFNATGIAAISKTDVSKFGGRNANYDVANVEPPYVAAGSSIVFFASADTADTTSDPKLVVTYTSAGVAVRRSWQRTMGWFG